MLSQNARRVVFVLLLGAATATMAKTASAQPVLLAAEVQVAQEYVAACEADRGWGEASAANCWLPSAKQAQKIQGLRAALNRPSPAGANAEIVAAYRAFLNARLDYEKKAPTQWTFMLYGGLGGAAVALDIMGGCGAATGAVFIAARCHDQEVADSKARAERAAEHVRAVGSKYGVGLLR